MPLQANACSSKFVSQRKVLLDALTHEPDKVLRNVKGGEGIYQHQLEAVLKLEEELRNPDGNDGEYRNISLAVLPTGTGKTGVAVLAAYCCGDNDKVLVVTPSETISKQQYRDFFSDDLDQSTFLESRGIFSRDDRQHYMPNAELITSSDRIPKAFQSRELIIVNAQKFGANSKVDLGQIPADRVSLVIIDEAHHYPAETWLNIVRHFKGCRIIFLTATPYNRGSYILGNKPPCYELSRDRAIEQGIIRDMCFYQVPEAGQHDQTVKVNKLLGEKVMTIYNLLALPRKERPTWERIQQILYVLLKMKSVLDKDDADDAEYKHQGMILAKDIHDAKAITYLWNSVGEEGECKTFVHKDEKKVRQDFEEGKLRVVVVIFRLIEGFDRKNVSVVGILRNVQPQSRVYFAQFVGRAVRKLHPQDPVTATIISHVAHDQLQNYRLFENERVSVAEEDPEDTD